MKCSWLIVALPIVCVCLLPSLARAQKVNVDFDKSVDFAKFKTYAWQEGQSAANPLVHKRIVNAIEGQLTAKGWTKVEESPSAVVIYYAAIDEQRQLNAWGSGPRWTGGTANVETILVGQMVLDIYDVATRQLVWRGFASDTASDKADKNEKKINEAVAKLFKQFPPSPSKSH
jgi:uncharacterized protein DUF4136